MKILYVLYDAGCPFCRRCRRWLELQQTFVALRFVPIQSPEVVKLFPGIEQCQRYIGRLNPCQRAVVVYRSDTVCCKHHG